MKQSKNILNETKKRLDQLCDKRARESSDVESKLIALKNELSDMQRDLEQAAADTDLSRYEMISKKIESYKMAISMYETKKASLSGAEGITHAESDATIDALIAYQNTLTSEYVSAISEPLATIRQAQAEYRQSLDDLRNLIMTWQNELNMPYRNGQSIPQFVPCTESLSVGQCISKIDQARMMKNRI